MVEQLICKEGPIVRTKTVRNLTRSSAESVEGVESASPAPAYPAVTLQLQDQLATDVLCPFDVVAYETKKWHMKSPRSMLPHIGSKMCRGP